MTSALNSILDSILTCAPNGISGPISPNTCRGRAPRRGGSSAGIDSLSAGFFSQVGVDASTTPAAAATALQGAGDQMLQAVIFHSDNLELSEQFDATTGYEKSVSNLSWSYASFLSAVRARNAI
ncbi:MAG TPA: glycoside hydrolase family 15 protein [Streptosporangiaceae bacterium]|nr:glycoside hydrolase family 15 protein [Streptosporangiaceae bacterium]